MQSHREIYNLTMDLRACLKGHEAAVEYIVSVTPFFDLIYMTTVSESVPEQFNDIPMPNEFARAFFNQLEVICDRGQSDFPDWVIEHMDEISKKTIGYLARFFGVFMQECPGVNGLTVLETDRIGPSVMIVTVTPAVPRPAKPIRWPINENSFKIDLLPTDNDKLVIELKLDKGFIISSALTQWAGIMNQKAEKDAILAPAENSGEGSTNPGVPTAKGKPKRVPE